MGVAVRAVGDADLTAVGEFLHRTLNQRLTAEEWARATTVPWQVQTPNRGFLLEDGDRVVGVHLAFYSERIIAGRREQVCNLGAWSVESGYRTHSLRLLRKLLAQPGYVFTDFSASGAVVPLNERLGFAHIDTRTWMVPCLPYPSRAGRVRIVAGSAVVDFLPKDQLALYRDHSTAAAAHHVVLQVDDRCSYVVFRHDRRKGLPLFASLLHVSDQEVFRAAIRVFARHLLVRHQILVLLAEDRLIGHRPTPSRRLDRNRRKMVKGLRSEALDDLDYLYSELACVAW